MRHTLPLLRLLQGGFHPAVNSDTSAAQCFIQPVGGFFARGVGQCSQRWVGFQEIIGHAEFADQAIHFFQIMNKRLAALDFQGGVQHLCSHKRVAIAVASNPRAHGQHLAQRVLFHWQKIVGAGQVQQALQLAVHLRHLCKKCGIEIGQGVAHLIHYAELVSAQQAGLKQALHGCLQFIAPGCRFIRGQADFITVADQGNNTLLSIQHTFALYLGGVRGQHRHRFSVFQTRQQGVTAHTHPIQFRNGVIQTGLACGHASQFMLPVAANQVAVFGDVAQHRKNRERANQGNGFVLRQRFQPRLQLGTGGLVIKAAVLHRQLAHFLNGCKHGLALLFGNNFPKQCA